MRNKKLLWQIPFLAFLITGTVLIIRQQRNMPYQKDHGFIFGTTYTVTYQHEKSLQKEIEERLLQVDSALSMFNKHSVISRINTGNLLIPHDEKGKMFLDVYNLAMRISKETDGAFDITVAPLVNAWGFGFKNDVMPTKAQVDSIRAFIGYQTVNYWSRDGQQGLNKNDKRVMLDCSAIAKGYGVDVVARFLRKEGVKNFMVEIGGEVVTKGVSSKRLPWKIGVTKPSEDAQGTDDELQAVLNVTDKAMATSGNYRNFYYKDGKRYAHTIDPATGYPVQHSLLSATVLAPDCATADAYATAFMVMGIQKAKQVLKKHKELLAYFIYSDQAGNYQTWYSPALEDKLQK